MLMERLMLKMFTSRPLSKIGAKLMGRRVWTVRSGHAAGMQFKISHNPEYIVGVNELPVQNAIATRLRPGNVFYDIGANIGFFSMIAARTVGSAGQVYAFEPLPDNAKLVRENAVLNGFVNVETLEVAVADRSGKDLLRLSDWLGGASLATQGTETQDPHETVPVRVVAIDELIATERLLAPNFVKIDVEGAELDVLKGMTRTLSNGAKPALLYEVDDGDAADFRRRWDELDGFVRDHGYAIARLEPSYPKLRWNVGHSLALPA